MSTISLFLTILAWIYLVISLAKLALLIFTKTCDPMIYVAELLGQDPIGDAVRKAGLVFLVCATWLIARALT